MKKPWENEPDREEFEYLGFRCLINRNNSGVWCGYVEVPDDHAIVRDDYDDISIDVHGGLTFGTYAINNETKKRVYIMGFDCAHSGDFCPKLDNLTDSQKFIKNTHELLSESTSFVFEKIYRDIEFAKNECKSIVDQVIKFESK